MDLANLTLYAYPGFKQLAEVVKLTQGILCKATVCGDGDPGHTGNGAAVVG